MPFNYSFTPEIIRSLQEIERARTEVGLAVLPPTLAEDLRLRARLRSTHFSTRIEGNRLSLDEAEQAIVSGREFRGRERDTLEVKHTFQALEQVEQWVEQGQAISEEAIRRLHAIIYKGRRAKPSAYRDGQNIIRDGASGIVYLPPAAEDVPGLMAELVAWITAAEKDLPYPIIAGVVHYQFVTIHPFYDGNGRTARALATWILYRGGYDLGRFYALEEFYYQDLPGYYAALVTHPHHNYYEGRAAADITPWLAYFLRGMAQVFSAVAREIRAWAGHGIEADESLLRALDPRARRVLSLFSRSETITASAVANLFGLSARQARDLLKGWVVQSWLEVSDSANKSRRYRLSALYRRNNGGLIGIRIAPLSVEEPI